jgi:CRISPR-associated endonuclease Cas1
MTDENPTGVPPARPVIGRDEARQSRLVYESPALSPDDIADDVARRADACSYPDSEHVAVVDGFGARVAVERGHLELHDGVGENRRVRRYAKVDAPRRVVVGIGTVGAVSFDALRWCSSVGTSLVVLGQDGALLAAGPSGRNDARLLRAQALALYSPSGVEVTRYLIAEKLRGQAEVLGLHLWEHDAASTILDLANAVENAGSIDDIRQAEAAAANVYFAAWERRVVVTFARKDLPRIPDHWIQFNGRRSSINPGSPRSATDPAGAALNYAYKLAEVEAALAARRIGLDPSIGILHADVAARPSFACDLMEAIRPVVDAHVLGVLAGPLLKRNFTEDGLGVVRCLAPITHRLAEAMPSYALALGPVTETVAGILAKASPYDVNVPSVLSGAKHKAAARRRVDSESKAVTAHPAAGIVTNSGTMRPPRRRRTKPPASPPLPLKSCRGCGGRLSVESDRATARTEWCPSCLAVRREEVGSSLPEAARSAAKRFAERTGMLPTHTPEARASRSASMRAQRMAQSAFRAKDHPEFDPEWYRATIQPALAGSTLPAIARATGVSTSAAAKWRAGRATPHVRHWASLAELVGVQLAEDVRDGPGDR